MALIIFDLDGTLAKTNEDLADSVNSVRKAHGFQPLSLEEITCLLGCGIHDLMTHAMPELHSEEEIQKSIEEQIGYYDKCFNNKTQLYDGVPSTLEALSRKHTLSVFTNKVMHQARGILECLGVAKYFKCIIGNDGSVPLKPAAEAVFHVAKIAGCSLDGAWIVGDNWTDLQAAHNAGIKSCFCQFGFGNPRKVGADAYITRFELLEKVIN